MLNNLFHNYMVRTIHSYQKYRTNELIIEEK